MISRGVRIQLLVFLLIAALGISYTGIRYVGLADPVGEVIPGLGLDTDYTVSVDLPRTAGLFENAEVSYRGVAVGRVSSIDLAQRGARATLELERRTPIPDDLTAVVAFRSAAGEQYLDLRPNRRSGPYLEAGSVIPRENTKVPIQTSTVLLNVDELVTSLPKDDLRVALDELDRAFSGTGPELRQLVESSNELIEEADSSLPETVALINDGKTVLDTQRAQESSIRTFATHLESLSGQIRESDPDLRRTLDNGIPAAGELEGLLTDVRPTLPVLLGNLTTVGQIIEMRLPGLRQVFVAYPMVVAGSYSVAPGDGTAHFGLVVNVNEPPPCTKGYEGTDRRYPQNTSEVPANNKARCAEPKDSKIAVRGARNAPSPGMPSGAAGQSGGGAGLGGAGQVDAQGAGPAASGDAPYVAGYDPITGRVIGPNGNTYVMGSMGGQKRVLGKDSWKWLLLGPLAG
ncbi:MAG: MCE family protein [Streptosporangiales bacterium]|nr:MCE family protein [Streptosporangiales bacterium]